MKREDLKIGLRVSIDTPALGGETRLGPLVGSTGTIVFEDGSKDGIPFVKIDKWPSGLQGDDLSKIVTGLEDTTALFAIGLTQINPEPTNEPVKRVTKQDSRSVDGSDRVFPLSEQEVVQLSSHSKTARKFFGSKFPGITLRRFYPGTKYRYVGPDNTGWKPGNYLLASYYDGVALLHLATGHAHTDFIGTKFISVIDKESVQRDDKGGIIYVTRDWVNIDKVFENLSWWEKVK